MPLITQTIETDTACADAQVRINTRSGYTCFDEENKKVGLMISRGDEEFNLSGMQIIVSGGGEIESFEVRSNLLDKLEEKTYIANVSLTNVEEASVAPIIKIGKEEKLCGISSKVEVPTCSAGAVIQGFEIGGGEEETCDDGISNQDETGVDCGGVCINGIESICDDGLDNDFDCLVDNADSDCTLTETTYYISSTTGNDISGDGSESNPYRTFSGINLDATDALSPGDTILFKRGDEWIGDDALIWVDSSGTSANWINFTTYGTGAKPIFRASTLYTGTWTNEDADRWYTDTKFTSRMNVAFQGLDHILWGVTAKIYLTRTDGVTGGGRMWYDYTNDRVYVILAGSKKGNILGVANNGGGNARFTTDAAHGLLVGEEVHISETYRFPYNDAQIVTAVPTPTTFDIAVAFHSDQIGKWRTTAPANPNNEDIYLPVPIPSHPGGRGVVTCTMGSQYISFKDIHVEYSNENGFACNDDWVWFEDADSQYTDGAGFYFFHNVVPPAGADYGRALRCTSSWGSLGTSQCFTVEGAYTWLIDCSVNKGGAASFDFLTYPNKGTGLYYTDSHHSGLIGGVSVHSSLRPRNVQGTSQNQDAAVYVDGADNILIQDSVFYDPGWYHHVDGSTSIWHPGISINDEHSSDNEVTNIDLVNNLFYGSNDVSLSIGGGTFKPTLQDIFILGNTFVRAEPVSGIPKGTAFRLIRYADLTSDSLYVYNNIFSYDSNHVLINWGDDETPNYYNGDYNVFFCDPNELGKFFMTDGSTDGNLVSEMIHVQGTNFETNQAHGFEVGWGVTIEGTTSYNGKSQVILVVPDATHFVTGKTFVSDEGVTGTYRVGETAMTFAGWQTWTGQDANSVNGDPLFVDDGLIHGGYHLSNTLSGDASDSPALDVGDEGFALAYAKHRTSYGSTRTDDVQDDTGDFDIGFHYMDVTYTI